MSGAFSLLFSGQRSLDSFADRLNCRHTVCILLVIAILAMVRVLVSAPITCHTPSEFSTQQSKFAEQICWTSSASVTPRSGFDFERRVDILTNYYQWIPLILAFQAFLFCLPKLFCNLTSHISGSVSVRNILESEILNGRSISNPDGAAQSMQYMAKCLGRHLAEFSTRWKLASSSEKFWLLLSGNWTFVFCIVVKSLYVINVMGQLWLLDRFLGSDDHNGPYGFEAFRNIRSGAPWKTSPTLPSAILCDYEILRLGTLHRYTVTCSLPMNLWYEIIFMFLWCWFVFVALATIASLVNFVFLQFNIFYQERYCGVRLLAFEKVNEAQRTQVSQFAQNFLTRDAWFAVQNIGRISGDQKATELVCGLWESYIASGQEKEFANIPS